MYNFSSWPMVNVSKIVMSFKTNTSIPVILNLASHKANQLFALCNQKDSNLKLKFEAKLLLSAENVFLLADFLEKPSCLLVKFDGNSAEFLIIL